ncbi:MAG: 30S ribosomal protein S8e [Candidatus Woesearchaeota archaeon]|jgi:small subunit ribosomal protein S8e|nr:30S ribosomal protein S8e [Candidatus Woesearchaeota archaeon]MDP7457980.1 30S ribosomal protein S8e [Candidatus Woesearchaeota archaeon]
MAKSQLRAHTKPTGGRLKAFRKKRKYELAGLSAHTKIGPKKTISHRKRGGSTRVKLLVVDTANVYDPKSKKVSKTKIKSVSANPANRHFVRRNILTKGAEIETELGIAKVTSRPGKEGVVNAVLLEKQKAQS